MAKTGFYLRGANGKLAGATIYQSKAGTVMREIVTPTNAKTTGQMRQRALFQTVVKFYKHANQRLFKFAFEDRRQSESDYNAFVRHNTQRSAIYMRESAVNEAFPAIGNNWQLSQGSLGTPNVAPVGDRIYLYSPSITGEETTLGQLFAKIMVDYNLNAGDIITFVAIRSVVQSVTDEPSRKPDWNIYQFRLDPNAGIQLGDVFSAAEGALTMESSMTADDACACGVIFSRNVTGGGLKCSTSYLANNDVAAAIFAATQQEAYLQSAINSWGAKGEAILQGSLSEPIAPVDNIEITMFDSQTPEDFPIEVSTESNPWVTNVQFSGPVEKVKASDWSLKDVTEGAYFSLTFNNSTGELIVIHRGEDFDQATICFRGEEIAKLSFQ